MAFQPQYYKDFACIGGDCQYNCCHGWEIELSESDYDRLMSIDDAALKKRLAESVDIYSRNPFKARFKMVDSETCSFLCADGFCEIHLKYGHSYLSGTCKSYPRRICSVSGDIEVFTYTSCETAVKNALFNTNTITLIKAPVNHECVVNFVLDTGKYTPRKDGADIFWKLRIATLYAIQNRRRPVWLRMVSLGGFIKQAGEFITSGREGEIEGLAEEFMSGIDGGDFGGCAEQIQGGHVFRISIIAGILEQVKIDLSRKKQHLFSVYVDQMKEGLGISGETRLNQENINKINDKLTEVYTRYYTPFFKSREYIFEHYLVNTILMTGFPFTYGKEGSIYTNFVKLAVKYVLIRFMMIGMAGFHKNNFGQNEVIRGISAFSRVFDHNTNLIDQIVEKMESHNVTALDKICMLLEE